MKRSRGITLLESLIALLIVAVLFVVAAPVVAGVIEKTRMAAVRVSLTESVLLAHRSAIASGARSVLCPTNRDATNCVEGSDWTGGWLAFIDRDGDRAFDADDTLLHRYPPLPGRLHLHSTSGRPRIVFHAEGDNAGSNLTFTLCGRHAKPLSLVLSNFSRMRAESAAPAAAGNCPPN